jgi:hypothetical protein
MAEQYLWDQLAWSLVGRRKTLCAVHMNGFPERQSQVRTAAASLTFYLRARHSRDAFDHDHEQHFAAVPTSQPADSPTVNAVAQGDGCTQTEIARLQSQLLNRTCWCGGQAWVVISIAKFCVPTRTLTRE